MVRKKKKSSAYADFIIDADKLVRYLSILVHYPAQEIWILKKEVDELIQSSKTATDKAHKERINEEILNIQNNRLKKHIFLASNTEIIDEIIFLRLIDYFNFYVSRVLYEIFKTKSGILEEGEDSVKIKKRDLIKFENNDQIIKFLAERKVDKLTYSSFEDLREYLKKSLKIKIKDKENEYSMAEIFQRRNILVHNGGIVNSIYLKSISESDYGDGDRVRVGNAYIDGCVKLILCVARDLDIQAVAKFDIS